MQAQEKGDQREGRSERVLVGIGRGKGMKRQHAFALHVRLVHGAHQHCAVHDSRCACSFSR